MRELLGYYEELGWIGAPVREELMRYAQGIVLADEDVEELEWRDWRSAADLHARSLLFVERLKGSELSPTLLRGLQRDVAWIREAARAFAAEGERKPRDRASHEAAFDAPRAPASAFGLESAPRRAPRRARAPAGARDEAMRDLEPSRHPAHAPSPKPRNAGDRHAPRDAERPPRERKRAPERAR